MFGSARLIKWFFVLFIFLSTLTTVVQGEDWIGGYKSLYEAASSAHDRLQYPSFLSQVRSQTFEGETVDQWIIAELEKILSEVKTWESPQRNEFFSSLLQHFSEKRGDFKASAVPFEASLNMENLSSGKYEAKELAVELMQVVALYEMDVIQPLLQQILKEIQSRYSDKYLFFTGRDFTSAYLYMSVSQKEAFSGQFISFNVSRKIRDAVENGQEGDLADLFFNASGISRNDLIDRGIAIFDSSMSGKIPRSIVFAISSEMSADEQGAFFNKVSVRNVKSKTRFSGAPKSFRRWLKEKVAEDGSIDRDAFRREITDPIVKVPVFNLTLPNQVSAYENNRHNLFEHRFKFLTSGTLLRSEGIVSPLPETQWEIAASLLGLYSETVVHALASGESLTLPFYDSRTSEERMAEIDQVFKKGGASALSDWQNRPVDQSTLVGFKNMRSLVEKNRVVEIQVDGRSFKIKGFIGEGINVTAYLTEDDQALKVIKKPEASRKMLMQHWMSPLLSELDIPIAQIVETHPLGLYSLQDYYPGLSMETEFSKYADAKEIPEGLNDRVVEIWQKSQALAKESDLWLDFRAANFQRDGQGNPVFVDLNPRFGGGFWRYYLVQSNGDFLNTDEFLETFYNYNLSKPNKTPIRPDDCLPLLD